MRRVASPSAASTATEAVLARWLADEVRGLREAVLGLEALGSLHVALDVHEDEGRLVSVGLGVSLDQHSNVSTPEAFLLAGLRKLLEHCSRTV